VQEQGRFPQAPVVSSLAAGRASSDGSLDVFLQDLASALLNHDTIRADQLLAEATAVHSLDDIILNGVVAVLAEIGRGWAEGRVDVATEHLATNYVRHHLVMWTMTGPPPYPIRPSVLACAPGELHEGGLLILGALLRRRRWPVAYLGQTVPLDDLSKLVQDMRPPAIVLVATMEETAQALSAWPQHLSGVLEARRPIVAFGGRIFSEQPEWRARVPGVFLGESLQSGVDKLEGLLRDATSLVV
jgi:methanogenic corrinoid protein MtbC1